MTDAEAEELSRKYPNALNWTQLRRNIEKTRLVAIETAETRQLEQVWDKAIKHGTWKECLEHYPSLKSQEAAQSQLRNKLKENLPLAVEMVCAILNFPTEKRWSGLWMPWFIRNASLEKVKEIAKEFPNTLNKECMEAFKAQGYSLTPEVLSTMDALGTPMYDYKEPFLVVSELWPEEKHKWIEARLVKPENLMGLWVREFERDPNGKSCQILRAEIQRCGKQMAEDNPISSQTEIRIQALNDLWRETFIGKRNVLPIMEIWELFVKNLPENKVNQAASVLCNEGWGKKPSLPIEPLIARGWVVDQDLWESLLNRLSARKEGVQEVIEASCTLLRFGSQPPTYLIDELISVEEGAHLTKIVLAGLDLSQQHYTSSLLEHLDPKVRLTLLKELESRNRKPIEEFSLETSMELE